MLLAVMSSSRRRGVDAVNQDFRRYEQVAKRQRYHLAEADHGEAFDDDDVIRACDIAAVLAAPDDRTARIRLAAELGPALAGIGFAVLTGHGVDPALYDRSHRLVRALFERPLADKLRFRAARHGSVN